MATLLGQKINATYDSLLKTEDNDGITGSLKQITDGVGQTTPLYLSTTEAKIGGNLEITGDLTVGGTTTYINTDNVTVKDGLVLLANDNVADIIDIGLYGKYNDGTVKYTGLYRDATDGKFKIFDGLTTEPTTTVGGGNLADFAAAGGSYSGNLIVDGNYYSTDGAISLTNGDIVTGGHIAINSGNAATSFSSNANNLIVGGVDSVAHQGLTIGSYSGATGNIFFADGITGDEQYRGLITYNHTNDTMYLGAEAANRVTISSGGLSVLTGGKIFVNGAGNNGYINSKGAVAVQVASIDNSRLFRGIDSSVQEVFYVQGTGDVYAKNNITSAAGSLITGYIGATSNVGISALSDLVFGTVTASTITEKMRIDTAGNVGIGDTPDTLLHIKGSAPSFKIESSDTSGTLNIPAGSINFFGGYSNSIEIASIRSIDASSGGIAGQLAFYTSADPDTPTERMRIDSSGNVGIGTSSPADKLELKDGNIRVTTSSSFSKFKSGRASVPSATGFNLGGLGFDAYSTGTTYVTGAQIESFSEGAWSSSSAPSYLSFQTVPSGSTSLSERMRIDSSGNVIAKGGTIQVNRSDSQDQYGIFGQDSSGGYVSWQRPSSSLYENFRFIATNTSGSVERMRITSGGYLKASNTGTYSSATALFHEIRTNSANSYIARFDNTAATNSGFAGINIRYTSLSPDANTNDFIYAEDSTAVRFRVYSDGDVWTSDAGTLLSDETLKRDITDASPKLDDIMKLRVRNYYWKEDYHPNKQDKKLIGFIAQEFEEVFPNMVSEHTIKDAEYETIEHPAIEATYDEEGNELTPAQDAWTETTDVLISEEVRKKGIKEGKLIPIIVKAMQEQQEIIQSQGDLIKQLEARIAALEAR